MNYHPFFSILDPSISSNDYFARSPLLFWSIIGVASHRYEDEPTLLDLLSYSVPKLVWKTIGRPPHNIYMVEAIVLLCMWPFPTSSMFTDLSLIFISNAKIAAMQIGLHKPENLQDFSRGERQINREDVNEAAKIWSACYIAAQWYASDQEL